MTEKRPDRARKGGAGAPPRKPARTPTQDPTPKPPAGFEPRRAALDILTLVAGGRTLDQAFEACRTFGALEGPDRGLAHAIAAAVMRRRGTIDHVIGPYLDRPIPKRAERAMNVLRLAAAQSLFLKTPDHAVVSTAVALTKEYRETAGYAGLVNAIARKMAAAAEKSLKGLPERIDTPGWMWRGWERNFGPETARAIARAHQGEAAVDLTPRDRETASEIAMKTNGALLPTGSVRLPSGAKIPMVAGFDEGLWWVQDAAAALPAKLLGELTGKRIFDLCAAPGGKTMQLAAAGAEVVAVDIEGMRLRLIAENLERTKLAAETVKADVLEWTPDAPADAILLDAPCTATGTIRRHPDILWAKREEDLKSLITLQAAMIDKAISVLKPGGLLVYCTCSLQSEEGEKQAAAALARHGEIERIPVEKAEIGGLDAITRDGDLRTHPAMLAGQGGLDGFFAARFRKR
ncbi:MAG: transcription antitermination factor NusB [Parvularculaceae bacterium]|nr:methyltransferase domain-containing protein [Parvularculaceae bacterium]